MEPSVPIVWVCGPPGVGKTSVAWELYRRATEQGRPVAFVDVDQLGICYPERADDPGRHRLKARNVDAVRRNVGVAGAACLIVSGVVDPATGPGIAGAVTVRLRAEPAALVERLASRRGSSADAAAAVAEAAALDEAMFDASAIDTTGVAVDQIATEISVRIRSWSAVEVGRPPATEPPPAPGQLLWLHGPPGVGKSTVGFHAYLDVVRSGRVTVFVDVDQLGFFDPPRGTRTDLQARNLAAIWAEFAATGAELAVVVGPIGSHAEAGIYEDAMPQVAFAWCALHADESELTRRILSRGEGGSWPQPGDPLRSLPRDVLLAAAAEAAAQNADAPDALDRRVDVTHLAAPEAAAAILAAIHWPPAR